MKFSVRKTIFFIHLWTGVVLGLWFSLIGVTGSVLAWLPELISYELRVRTPFEQSHPDQPIIPLSQAISEFKKAVPDLKPGEVRGAILPNYRYAFYLFSVRRKGGDFKVDPYSGKVHPPFNRSDLIIGNVASFHESLILGPKGLIANGVASFFSLFMLISGVWLWWPSTMRQLKIRLSVKRGATFRRFIMDLHNVLGIYLFGIVFLTTATAVLLVANSATRDGVEKAIDKRAGVTEAPPTVISSRGEKLSEDILLQKAKEAVPDIPVFSVRLAGKPGSPFTASFQSQDGFLNSAKVELDPHTGQVVKLERGNMDSPGHKTIHLTEELHYGFFGGVTTKLLYTFAGLIPLGLFVTGLIMWWKRKQAEKAQHMRRAAKTKAKTASTEETPIS